MDGTGCFDHTCGGEGALDKRLEDVGYLDGGLTRWAYGENIAWGTHGEGEDPGSIVARGCRALGTAPTSSAATSASSGSASRPGPPTAPLARSGGIYTVDFGLRVG